MKILATNDDGFDAEGLDALVRRLEACRAADGSALHEVWVLAPDTERSGVSHAMTLKHPSKIRKLADRRYTCSGTPADCVILAELGVLEFKPDLVVSGINRGPNLGTDIVYSGTCGAARQAALAGVPGIAVSCTRYAPPIEYDAVADFVARHLQDLYDAWRPDTFVNVNGPAGGPDLRLQGRWAIPGRNRYHDKLKCFEGADGYTYCFLAEGRHEREASPASDHLLTTQGYAAVSLIAVHPVYAHDPGLNGLPAFPAPNDAGPLDA